MAQNTQKKLNNSLFPDFPRESPVINKEGNFTEVWHLQLSSLFQALQKNFRNEGLQTPQLDINDINTISSLYQPYINKKLPQTLPDISGHEIFDTTNRVRKVFIITYDNTAPPAGPLITAAGWKTYTIT